MIYVDAIKYYPNTKLPYKRWCHMASDNPDLEELHQFAARLGLKRAWFQNKLDRPHYDLVPTKRALAMKLGAQAVTTQQLIGRCYPELVRKLQAVADELFTEISS